MKKLLSNAVAETVIIPAIKDEGSLDQCLELEQAVIFVLFGDVCSISGVIDRLHRAGKYAVVHADLINGLSQREIAADFLSTCGADGIISTRPNVIRRAGELGLMTILRFFVFDSKASESAEKTALTVEPDMVEILPGIMPRVISRLAKKLPVPLLCGGLIEEKDDILAALDAGAVAISTTRKEVWKL